MSPLDLSRVTWQLVAVIALVLGAYVGLALAGVDTGQLVAVIVTLLGGSGVVAHQAVRLDRQDKALAKITKQTNGVLDQRIHDGATSAIVGVLRRAGFKIPDEE